MTYETEPDWNTNWLAPNGRGKYYIGKHRYRVWSAVELAEAFKAFAKSEAQNQQETK
jgi:hypothetical protein